MNSRSYDSIDVPKRTLVLDSQQVVRYPDNVFLDDYIRLPCTVSDPAARVTLLKRERDGSFAEVPQNDSVIFVPSKGFLINFREIKNPWGTYHCREEEGKNTLQVLLLPEKGTNSLTEPTYML